MADEDVPVEDARQDQRFAEYARERLQAALSGLADDVADGDVLGPAQLGLMALHMHYGSTETVVLVPSDVLEHIDQQEPKCICPPGLVARGGFRGGCPVHN